MLIHKQKKNMKKQQKYRIVCNEKDNFFRVEKTGYLIPYPVFIGGPGQAGLEACEEWLLAKQQVEE